MFLNESMMRSTTGVPMIINRHGQAKTLTGYTDAYAIEQAISEARRVK